MSIEKTGVLATESEVQEAKRLARTVSTTPFVMRQIDTWAVAHGLPEPALLDGEPNHYGLTNEGEFTRYVPDGVEHNEIP